MISPDLINGLFELVGSLLTWRNALQLYRDQELKGVYWPVTFFFTAWGAWNLIYYPALNQWLSFVGAALLLTGNVAWLALLFKFKRSKSVPS